MWVPLPNESGTFKNQRPDGTIKSKPFRLMESFIEFIE